MASRWLVAAAAAFAAGSLPEPRAKSANSAKRSGETTEPVAFGTNDTIGTVPGERRAPSQALDPAYLRGFYEERAAICEFDGGEDSPRAEARAWHEVASIWYRQHGQRAPDGLCAGCGEVLGAEADVLPLPHGERAHAVAGYACIIAYGRRWKSEAAAALPGHSISTPAEFVTELLGTEEGGRAA
jgi:hypothetical protein